MSEYQKALGTHYITRELVVRESSNILSLLFQLEHCGS